MTTYDFRPHTADDSVGAHLESRPGSMSHATRVVEVDQFHLLDAPHAAEVHHRGVQSDQLSPIANRWLHKLPVEVRPIITARRHPHVINRLCAVWGDAGVRQTYFQELLFSSRPGRRGFSFEVMDELVDLQNFGLYGRKR